MLRVNSRFSARNTPRMDANRGVVRIDRSGILHAADGSKPQPSGDSLLDGSVIP